MTFELPAQSEISDRHWFALQVSGSSVFTKSEILREFFEVYPYVPFTEKQAKPHRYTRQREPRRIPLLPGYILGGFLDAVPRWLDLYERQVVNGVLGWQGKPMEIRWNSIWELMEMHGRGAFDAPMIHAADHGLHLGDYARVTAGPLNDMDVRIVAMDNKQATIVFKMFGAENRAKLNLDVLVRIEP